MSFKIEEATIADAECIAKVFVSTSDNEFLRLQMGTAQRDDAVDGMTDSIKRSFDKPHQIWLVARDEDTGKVVSFAQWVEPNDETEQTEEIIKEQQKEVERRRQYIKPGMNEPFLIEIWNKMFALRGNALKGRKHYLLANLGTSPEYRRKGLASKMVQWALNRADTAGEIAYLDTEETGNALRIYERLGFKKVGETTFDLSQHGGDGLHTHVAMIREPNGKRST